LAFAVFDYTTGNIAVWEITQSSIQKELQALEKDPDWGSLLDYDLEIERTGHDMMSTKYRVTPKPKQQASEEIVKLVADNGLPYLEALYDGQNPFSAIRPEDLEEVSDEDAEKIAAVIETGEVKKK
jgi:hypothetical protein